MPRFARLGTAGVLALVAVGADLGRTVRVSSPAPIQPSASAPKVQKFQVPWRYVEDPAADGSTLIWQAAMKGGPYPHDGPQSLYTSAVHPFRPRLIAHSPAGSVPSYEQVQISSHWIVWMDGDYTWRIWAVDRATHKKYLIDSSMLERAPPPFVWTLPTISLYGNVLAWTPTRCQAKCYAARGAEHWTSYVRWRRLPGGPIHSIYRTAAPCHQYWPSLAKDVLIWMQEGDCPPRPGSKNYAVHGTDLLMTRLSDGRVRQLTHDGVSSVPSTNGRYLAWKVAVGRTANGAIMLRDLRTGKQTMLSRRVRKSQQACTAGPGWPWTQCDVEPHMLSDNVVWFADTERYILGYNLHSHRRFVLDRSTANSSPDTPLGSAESNTAIWFYGKDINNPRPGQWSIQWYIVSARLPAT